MDFAAMDQAPPASDATHAMLAAQSSLPMPDVVHCGSLLGMPYEVHEAWQAAWSCELLVSIKQIWDAVADDNVPSTNLSDRLNSISLSLQRLGDKL